MTEHDNIKRMREILDDIGQHYLESAAFFEMSKDLLCVADAETMTFLRLNSRWSKELGWSIEELMSKPYPEFVHPDDQRATIVATEHLGLGLEVMSFENRYMVKSGGWSTLNWNAVVDPKNGKIYATARVVEGA